MAIRLITPFPSRQKDPKPASHTLFDIDPVSGIMEPRFALPKSAKASRNPPASSTVNHGLLTIDDACILGRYAGVRCVITLQEWINN